MMTAQDQPGEESAPHPGWFFLLLGAAFLASLVVFVFVEGGLGDVQRLRDKKQDLLERTREQRRRYHHLVQRRKRLRHDPYLIEELAREKLGLHTPGEQVVRPDPAADTALSSRAESRRSTGPDTHIEVPGSSTHPGSE